MLQHSLKGHLTTATPDGSEETLGQRWSAAPGTMARHVRRIAAPKLAVATAQVPEQVNSRVLLRTGEANGALPSGVVRGVTVDGHAATCCQDCDLDTVATYDAMCGGLQKVQRLAATRFLVS